MFFLSQILRTPINTIEVLAFINLKFHFSLIKIRMEQKVTEIENKNPRTFEGK
jgi:hypothetical protein